MLCCLKQVSSALISNVGMLIDDDCVMHKDTTVYIYKQKYWLAKLTLGPLFIVCSQKEERVLTTSPFGRGLGRGEKFGFKVPISQKTTFR